MQSLLMVIMRGANRYVYYSTLMYASIVRKQLLSLLEHGGESADAQAARVPLISHSRYSDDNGNGNGNGNDSGVEADWTAGDELREWNIIGINDNDESGHFEK